MGNTSDCIGFHALSRYNVTVYGTASPVNRHQHRHSLFLLRVLWIAEATWGFDSYAAFIRTYHNVIPDNLTREAWQQAQPDHTQFTTLQQGVWLRDRLAESQQRTAAAEAIIAAQGRSIE